MSVTIESLRPARSDEWDELWRDCETATYFHSREWAELWETYTDGGVRPRPLLVRFDDGRRALLPFLLETRFGGLLRTRLSSYAETFGGWISTDELGERHATLLADWLLTRAGDLRWKLNPFDPLTEGLRRHATADDETLALDLTEGFDALRRRWSKGHRAAVTQARRLGVTVRIAETPADWLAYDVVFRDSIRRWGDTAFFQYSRRLFEELGRLRSPNVELYLALHEGRVVAGHVFLHARRHVADWHGAALSDAFVLRPVNLLMAEAIQAACERGTARWFDFGSSGPLEGVRNFKKGFRPVALPCPSIRVDSAWRRRLRRLAGRGL